ncbi:hypothetical protein cyc_04817 [Cyclospora cayetanensis]|nr:hypothetical protein cyc_04817 [Cyclospora cayetanensis]
MKGDFVDNWGSPVAENDLPEELGGKAGAKPSSIAGGSARQSLGWVAPAVPPKQAAPSAPRASIAQAVGSAGGLTITAASKAPATKKPSLAMAL